MPRAPPLPQESGKYVARIRPLLTPDCLSGAGKGRPGWRCLSASSAAFISGRKGGIGFGELDGSSAPNNGELRIERTTTGNIEKRFMVGFLYCRDFAGWADA